jgi:peptidoglycan-N-acetylglucosamine deacetylase
MPAGDRQLYLSFDDGPGPGTTPRILDMLKKYGVKATFFCVGENIERNPGLFESIKAAGHATGNHTHNHLKGWKASTAAYLNNVEKCQELVQSRLFRPPYGKMTSAQRRALKKRYRIIMWTVLSRDYDPAVDPVACLMKTLKYTRPGAIILFHDNPRALDKVEYVLPRYLEKTLNEGYRFDLLA